jgi:hypothetical protein
MSLHTYQIQQLYLGCLVRERQKQATIEIDAFFTNMFLRHGSSMSSGCFSADYGGFHDVLDIGRKF